MPPIYPFTAVVGQERMKRALVLNAVNPRIGGVLIRGERGTAKSISARALAALLPQVRVVKDCRFACDPDHSTTWCTECRERNTTGEALPVELRLTSFVNLPVSATEDRVVGTLDIEKAIQKGERRFEAGVLAFRAELKRLAGCRSEALVDVTDAHTSTALQNQISGTSGAITLSGTPAASELVQIRIRRNPADGGDTLAVDAMLIGVMLTYTRS